MKKILLLLLFIPNIIFGQATNPLKINEIVEIKSKTALAIQGYQYIELNKEAFGAEQLVKGTRLLFESKLGVTDELEITRVTHYVEGAISIIARKVGEINNEFALTYSAGKITGIYYRTAGETLFLGYQQEMESNYISDKPIEEPIFSKEDDGIVVPNYRKSTLNKNKYGLQAQSMVPNVVAMAASLEDTITIDVMLVYTEAAKAWADSNAVSIDNLLAQVMNKSQLALDNSNTAIELRLVHKHKTDYDELNDGVSSGKRLERITTSPNFPPEGEASEDAIGYMDEVHVLRDQYGADLVALIADINDTGGIAYRLGSTTGRPELAFSVNRVQQLLSDHTLIHELGHNMGNGHARTQEVQPANRNGGLFQYSAGYQEWTGKFYTIMSYPYKDHLASAPIFSSPDLMYSGKPAGTNHMFTPEDNARSLREIKTVIAGYRPSKINPPILTPITNTISVEMNREDELTVPISITNTGASRLMWAADFDIPTNTVNKVKSRQQSSDFKSIKFKEGLESPANASFTNTSKAKNASGETVIYSTSFETEEGFILGNHKAISQWRTLSDGNSIKITDVNSKTGTKNLRLESKVGENTQFVSSPFFGAQAFGTYEIELDMALGGLSAASDRFDIYVYDGKNDEITGGIVISEATIYAWGKGEDGDIQFYSTGTTAAIATYNNFKMRFDNNTETVSYYYGGELIATRDFVDGRTPDEIYFLHGNNFAGTTFDIDNLKVTRFAKGYDWLAVNSYGGVVNPSGSQNINLTFNTEGIEAGNYETKMIIKTNDPTNTLLEIPVNLTVKSTVSNVEEIVSPEAIALSQNYPNPFNPETVIAFTLNEPTNVRLEIFTIQGQKVATLFNTKLTAGSHKARYNAENLASGVYLYRLSTPLRTLTRKMTLIK